MLSVEISRSFRYDTYKMIAKLKGAQCGCKQNVGEVGRRIPDERPEERFVGSHQLLDGFVRLP